MFPSVRVFTGSCAAGGGVLSITHYVSLAIRPRSRALGERALETRDKSAAFRPLALCSATVGAFGGMARSADQSLARPRSYACFASSSTTTNATTTTTTTTNRNASASTDHEKNPNPNWEKHQQNNKHLDDVSLALSYRSYGHAHAALDPLQRARGHLRSSRRAPQKIDAKPRPPLGWTDNMTNVNVDNLHHAYTGSLALDARAVNDAKAEQWLFQQMERRTCPDRRAKAWPPDARRALLQDLQRAEALEHSLSRHFKTSKRFGIEGSDALMPALYHILKRAAAHGAVSVDLGMAHRGRLNVLVNVLGKKYAQLCAEMEGKQSKVHVGDVKYHLPATGVVTFTAVPNPGDAAPTLLHSSTKRLVVRLAPNPSHLEHVTPLVLGACRARQQVDAPEGAPIDAAAKRRRWAVVVHGDAAFAGQGISAESGMLSRLDGYTIGGAVHIVVDNGIGFTTTPDALYSSSHCASAYAAAAACPVIFANGDDPEACVDGARLCAAFRARFNRDAVLVLRCYRRLGHNESDDPSVTQPMLYNECIAGHSTLPTSYGALLAAEGIMDAETVEINRKALDASLDASRNAQSAFELDDRSWFLERGWQLRALMSSLQPGRAAQERRPPEPTGLPLSTLRFVRGTLCQRVMYRPSPNTFEAHPDVLKFYRENVGGLCTSDTERVDWATAEALAFGTLLLHRSAGPIERVRRHLSMERGNSPADSGDDDDPLMGLNYGAYRVRLSGQDSARGTFGQRHTIVRDVNSASGGCVVPLNEIMPGYQERFEAVDSPLSEAAVLGFEYGYSLVGANAGNHESFAKSLVLWEAQFGDFANVAQSIIDTYVMSAEEKWNLASNLVLLLPHGFDGQGPDHSSARVERFLQMVNDDADHLPGASERDVALIRRSFAALDPDNNGWINADELAAVLGEHLHKDESDDEASNHHGESDPDRAALLHKLHDHFSTKGEDGGLTGNGGELTTFSNMASESGGRIGMAQWMRLMTKYLRLESEAQANVHVCIPTTPAQYFHLLRRQMNRSFDKPLVVFAPKFLLHHRLARSDLSDFTTGTHFFRVIDDGAPGDNTRHLGLHPVTQEQYNLPPTSIRRVVLCSGQIYYALNRVRRQKYVFVCFCLFFFLKCVLLLLRLAVRITLCFLPRAARFA